MNPYRENDNQQNQQIEHNNENRENRGTSPDESQRQIQINMRLFISKNPQRAIMNVGYLDSVKSIYNTRILLLNLNRLRLSNEAKISMFIESYSQKQINGVLLYEINTK